MTMAADNPRGAMFRVIAPNQHSRVTNAELFFDLVFVFAVTQVSHTLLHHFTPLGAVHVTVLFLAVWWGGSTPPGSPTGSIPS
nr:low temperature requirement protein A [Bradyrhizobium liaoningense]